MAHKLLDTEDVLERVGYGLTWLQDRIEAGEFPAPVHKWRRNKWLESVVDDWIVKNFGGHQVNKPNPEEAHASH